ncbi:hypothetical protein PPTG_13060 [Phytophthora nicotianae INRA-310]|uniref:Uncharacterized protein n=1 Tax=Phytophthora nicotianae (strain INRA-310) TaxID=761204 RepID=W2Q653_PHYN3|nr:hypothetical protein PPTG_13060 [Phytophthora nicotianae INRA-310]ETN07735.1 hypothetical protein PPTG_13060 [Phytophthora nicotianae INRA-310]
MAKTRSSNSSTSDADEDRVTAPIFTPTLPPRLTSTSHAALVKWRRERREYEETIRSRAKDSAADLIVPVKSTFDEGLLRMWCLLRWKLSIDDVTDSHILAEVDKIIDSVKNNDVPDIDVEMREQLRMDLSESDVSERVIQYFKKCYEIVDDHGWRVFFTGLDGRKQLCRILIASLEPQALRDEVERAVRFQSRKAKEDEVALHDLILTKALDQEKAFQSLKRSKRDRGERETGRPSARGTGNPPNKKQRVVETSKGGPRPPLKSETDRPKVPPTPCPHCNDMHWLSECPTATDDQKAEIRRKLRAQRADDSKRKWSR